MRKHHYLALTLALSVASLVSAADTQGTRIYFIGNSLTDELKYDPFVALAKDGGEQVVWGRHMIPGCPIRGFWGAKGQGFQKEPFGHWDKALREYEWDVMTLQPFCPFQGEYEHALLFAGEAIQKSPEVQICVYAQWPGKGKVADWDLAFSGFRPIGGKQDAPTAYRNMVPTVPNSFKDRLKESSLRNEYELMVLGLRQNVPTKKPPVLIPAGHAMQLLGQKMRAGLVPGYRTPWDFYSDNVHVNNDCSYLVACTFYATIFKKSPVGLPVGEYQGIPGLRSDGVKITPELAKIIQETVWEVVATHPLTGVTSDEPLKVASPLLDPAVVGEPYRFEILPAFGKAPHAWSLANGKLPEGMTLTENGVLAGTPTMAGNTELTLTVADAAGAKATANFTLKVETPASPAIPEQSIPAMSVGKFMELPLRSESGNGVSLWRVKEGSVLPPGINLDGYGRLWGAPGKEGRYDFTLEVVDGKSANPGIAERAFTAEVGPASGEIAFARRLTEKIELGGVKEEADPTPWNFRYPITKLVQGDTATVSGAFDLAWDDQYLWVAMRIKDPTNNAGRRDVKFQGDTVVLCLDGFNNREATYNADDRFLVYPRKSPYPSPMSIGDQISSSCRQKELEDGYFVLFQVSFKNFGWPVESLPYRVIGLDLMIVDAAKDGVPNSTVVWQGTKDNATDPSQFGTVLLGSEDHSTQKGKQYDE